MSPNTKIKTLLVSIFLLIATTGIMAQDKYEFATITYWWGGDKVGVSIDGTEYKEEVIKLPKTENGFLNSSPLLTKVSEFQDKGWEVMSISFAPMGAAAAYSASK